MDIGVWCFCTGPSLARPIWLPDLRVTPIWSVPCDSIWQNTWLAHAVHYKRLSTPPCISLFSFSSVQFQFSSVQFSSVSGQFSSVWVQFCSVQSGFSSISVQFSSVSVQFSSVSVQFSSTPDQPPLTPIALRRAICIFWTPNLLSYPHSLVRVYPYKSLYTTNRVGKPLSGRL